MRAVYLFLLGMSCAQIGMAQAPDRSLTIETTPASLALSNAFVTKASGDWEAALATAAPAGQIAIDLIEWQRLRAGKGTFEETLTFLRRRSDWPGLPLLRKRSEKNIPATADSATVISFFERQAPRTLLGSLRLAQALSAHGKPEMARAEMQRGWINFAGEEDHEAEVLATFEEVVKTVHEQRLTALLWQGADEAANRMLDRVPTPAADLARARMALQSETGSVDAALDVVPAALKSDPGLAFDRFKWRLNKKRRAEAVDLILAQSKSAGMLGKPEKWAPKRLRLARARLDDGKYVVAYRLAANHHLSSGAKFAELEFLAGFLALRKLNRADVALYHFERHATAVTSPISLGRTHYWQGRAFEAMGKSEAALASFRNGAKYQTGFYGLLSAEKAGVPLDGKLAGGDVFPGALQAEFTDSSVYQAGQILLDAGQLRIGVRFLTHLAESLNRDEIGQMISLAEAADLPEIALLIGKRGLQYGSLVEQGYYPLHPLVDSVRDIPVEMALSIARRESEFFADARSGVGALGLMQLMPATANEVAGKLGLPFSKDRLISDPKYNARLGSEYLRGLYETFGNSPVQIAAAYNAGPSRPKRWMKERGDPRLGEVDVIDWIEQIPFAETRNYVMRVTEVLPIYKARLTGKAGPLEFQKLLKGTYVAPPPPPKPLAPNSSMRPLARPDVPATE